jgi:hypothetical protein
MRTADHLPALSTGPVLSTRSRRHPASREIPDSLQDGRRPPSSCISGRLTGQDIARVLRSTPGLARAVSLAVSCSRLAARTADPDGDLTGTIDFGCELTEAVLNALRSGIDVPLDLPALRDFLRGAAARLQAQPSAPERVILAAVYNAGVATERLAQFRATQARHAACYSLASSWNVLRETPSLLAAARELFVTAGFSAPDAPNKADQGRLTPS